MTDAAKRSWSAWQRTLSDPALAALHRGLTNGDPDACNPIVYALQHGDGLRGEILQRWYEEIDWQASVALNHCLMAVTEWRHWVAGRPRVEAYAGLAAEIEMELERRRLARSVPSRN